MGFQFMAFASETISTVINVINAINNNNNNNNNNNINDLDSNNENMNPAKRRKKRWIIESEDENNKKRQWCQKLGEISPRCILSFIEDEKRQNVANPGFEGIKKWLEVFLLSGGWSLGT